MEEGTLAPELSKHRGFPSSFNLSFPPFFLPPKTAKKFTSCTCTYSIPVTFNRNVTFNFTYLQKEPQSMDFLQAQCTPLSSVHVDWKKNIGDSTYQFVSEMGWLHVYAWKQPLKLMDMRHKIAFDFRGMVARFCKIFIYFFCSFKDWWKTQDCLWPKGTVDWFCKSLVSVDTRLPAFGFRGMVDRFLKVWFLFLVRLMEDKRLTRFPLAKRECWTDSTENWFLFFHWLFLSRCLRACSESISSDKTHT